MSHLLDLLYPRTCYGCGRPGFYLCPACLKATPILSVSSHPRLKPLSGLLSVFSYHSPVGSCLQGLKYDFVSNCAFDIAALTARTIISHYPRLLSYWQSHLYCLVPIPLHPARENYRGFNQSALLGRPLASALKLVYLDNLLLRLKNTPSQAKIKNKKLRHRNLAQAFYLNPQVSLTPNTRLILFDDIATSNATLQSAASVLTPLNSPEIWGLSIAGPDPASARSRK